MCSKIVAYYRVSTESQARSGLGIDAQKAAVAKYAEQHDKVIVAEFQEQESGKRNDRPELTRAINAADVMGAKLVIARLDRLSRNAAFLLTLRDSGVPFVAADMPDACNLTIGVLALVAQQEREAISARTKAALAAAKARDQRLGHLPTLRPGVGQAKAVETISANARERAVKVAKLVDGIKAQGITSLRGVARELSRRGVETARGKAEWGPVQVARVLELAADAGRG